MQRFVQLVKKEGVLLDVASQCSVRYQLRMKSQQQAFLSKYIVYTQLYGFARRTEYQCGVGVVVVFASVRGALLQVGFG